MAITLAEAKVGLSDKVDQQVVDEFRRSSLLMDALTFDNSISPGTGGSTLTYGYVQLLSPATAGVRTINSEYTAGEAKRIEKTAKSIVMGGSFQIDRVIQNTSGAIDEMAFQLKEKVKATANEFHNLIINGIAASNGAGFVPNTFDGLNKLLSGSDTEIASLSDLSTGALLDANYNGFLDELDEFLGQLDGKPSMLLMNEKMLAKLRAAARRANYYTKTRDEFGRQVEAYNDIPLMDAGKYYNGTNTVDVIKMKNPTATEYGTTDVYAISLGLDGFHGISPQGDKLIKSFLPDLSSPGAVKTGEVELIAGAVLKNSKKAGVLRGIKIKPKTA